MIDVASDECDASTVYPAAVHPAGGRHDVDRKATVTIVTNATASANGLTIVRLTPGAQPARRASLMIQVTDRVPRAGIGGSAIVRRRSWLVECSLEYVQPHRLLFQTTILPGL